GRMSPRQQGEVLERAAGLEELRDFHPRDLKSALCERIFTTALAAAVGAADLPTLRRLVAGVLDVAAG
ncbi:MAG TPA: hypothetical protein PLS95_14775, partial [Thermoanaerobaculales bacterium]|nr:hypothetical protein [Thermoanaerobaculales bacterium]